MALTPGTRLGVYEITAQIGAGGMGEVYRATDSHLKRSVAIKVLPASVAGDADRLARFQREAEVLAALNHPNIGAIYGLEKTPDFTALVMELVEGDDLSQRIARGPIPFDEALPIAKQIADALEAAHEQGIIHRDLKPANIKVRSDGTVKLLDFGLAKATEASGASSPSLSMSPTITTPAMTQTGMILGTAAYMSPEQAAGKLVDKRSDLWALGVVLLEMLSGQRVFTGETVSHVLAGVLAKEPDWATLPSETPPPIRRLLARLLEKDRKRRIADASDVRFEIEDALTVRSGSTLDSSPSRPSARWSYVSVAVGAVVIGLAGGFAWRASDRSESTAVYASIDTPPGYVLGDDDFLVRLPTRTPMVFTPDGRSLVLQVARAGKPQLVVRSLDRPEVRPITGTEGALVPFVSPDGKWVGFSVANEIRKAPIEGGTPTTICPVASGLGPIGAAWGVHDVIVFGDPGGRIMRVPAGGGTPAPVTAAPAPRRLHVAPFFLPDGVRFLFSDVSLLDAGDSKLMVQSLDGGDARVVLASATDGRLLPSGRLAFMRSGTLMTVGFDLARAEVAGDPVAALSGVMQSGLRAQALANNTGAGMFAVSSRGDLVAVRGALIGGEENHLTSVTRDGRSSPADPESGAPAGARLYLRVSPDGSRVSVTVIKPTRLELWLADWKRDVWSVCSDCSGDLLTPPWWSPDGRRLLLARADSLVAHTVDGSRPDQVMVQEPGRTLEPRAWLADGRIVYMAHSSNTVNASATGSETKLLESGASGGIVLIPGGGGIDAMVSPDRHWLAYAAPQRGLRNIFVQAFPGPGPRTPISAGSGDNPVWSADGRTLYYLKTLPDRGGTAIVAVDVTTGAATMTAGTPRELFRNPQAQVCVGRCYDIADGRFLLKERGASVKDAEVTRLDLVLNWTSTLPRGR